MCDNLTRFVWDNVVSTSDLRPKRYDYWRANTEKICGLWCSVEGCGACAKVGAHVMGGGSDEVFIVPMCKACNERTESFNLVSGTSVVSADQNDVPHVVNLA